MVGVGERVRGFVEGERVGVAWLRRTCGECRFCRRGAENLCPRSLYTGWDADGGYADHTTVPADYALPAAGGLHGRGARAAAVRGHHRLPRATTRRAPGRRPARGLRLRGQRPPGHAGRAGAGSHGARDDAQPGRPRAGAASRRRVGAGRGRPSPRSRSTRRSSSRRSGSWCRGRSRPSTAAAHWPIAGIHLTEVPPLDYQRHLFQERTLRSVTSNTRADAREFLRLAGEHHLEVSTVPYPLEHAGDALADLAADRITGAAVLVP